MLQRRGRISAPLIHVGSGFCLAVLYLHVASGIDISDHVGLCGVHLCPHPVSIRIRRRRVCCWCGPCRCLRSGRRRARGLFRRCRNRCRRGCRRSCRSRSRCRRRHRCIRRLWRRCRCLHLTEFHRHQLPLLTVVIVPLILLYITSCRLQGISDLHAGLIPGGSRHDFIRGIPVVHKLEICGGIPVILLNIDISAVVSVSTVQKIGISVIQGRINVIVAPVYLSQIPDLIRLRFRRIAAPLDDIGSLGADAAIHIQVQAGIPVPDHIGLCGVHHRAVPESVSGRRRNCRCRRSLCSGRCHPKDIHRRALRQSPIRAKIKALMCRLIVAALLRCHLHAILRILHQGRQPVLCALRRRKNPQMFIVTGSQHQLFSPVSEEIRCQAGHSLCAVVGFTAICRKNSSGASFYRVFRNSVSIQQFPLQISVPVNQEVDGRPVGSHRFSGAVHDIVSESPVEGPLYICRDVVCTAPSGIVGTVPVPDHRAVLRIQKTDAVG